MCELQCGTYNHDDYGTVNYPIFHVVDWAFWDRNDEVPQQVSASSSMTRLTTLFHFNGRESHH